MSVASAPSPKGQSYWRKIGGGSLSISIMVHAILLVIAIFWVLQIIPKEESLVDFLPPSGGGGKVGEKQKTLAQKRSAMMPVDTARVAAVGASSPLTLPEPDRSFLSSVGALSTGGISGGLGGSGSGGGRGSGSGTGFGGGMGPGLSDGEMGKTPFGSLQPGATGLVGTYYDFKFDAGHNKLKDKWLIQDLCEVYFKFFKAGWNEEHFNPYYRAPKKLSTTRIAIPVMAAEKAPTFFGAKETLNPAWCVLYKGLVSPLESGTYRFLCTSDDGMAVRFNNRQVLSQHFCMRGGYTDPLIEGLYSEKMKPEEYIPHPKGYEGSGTALACGEWFTVNKDKWYPCEIIIMETGYGGVNSAVLLLQKKGDKAGTLQLFHFDKDAAPLPTEPGTSPVNIPDYDPKSPPWQVKPLPTKI